MLIYLVKKYSFTKKIKVLKIEIETETVPMRTGEESSMETQEMKPEKESSFKKIHFILFIFVFIQVM